MPTTTLPSDEIRLHLTKPDPARAGHVLTARMVTFNEFREQVKRVLEQITPHDWPCNAYDNAESFYSSLDLKTKYQDAVPEQGRLLVAPGYGHCEGFRIAIYFLGDDGTYEEWLSIKYICEHAIVWDIAKVLTEAVYEGTFN